MIRSPRALWIAIWLLATGGSAWSNGGRKNASTASDAFFARSDIATFKIEIAGPELSELERQEREYVRATVKVGPQTFPNAAIRLKGFGTYRSLDQTPSLAIKFNHYVPGQEFHGLTKILLNNSMQDATYLGEFMASSLFLDAGLPAARVTHAKVILNGRDLGLYVLIEAMNQRFLKRHFANATGSLYEGAIQDISTFLDSDNGTAADQADRRALVAAAKLRDPTERLQALRRILDVDRFLKFLALQMMISDWDGYALHRNNYRIYHDPQTDRMVFLPHGMDNTWHDPRLSIMPPRKSILVRALLDTAEGRDNYRQVAATLLTNVFRASVLTNRLHAAVARLVSSAGDAERARELERRGTELSSRIVERAQRLAEELNGIKPPTPDFDSHGVARLSQWRKDEDWIRSPLSERKEGDRRTLYINSNRQACTASWRLHVSLPPGRYTLEGTARTARVAARGSQTGMGAGLRILGNQRGPEGSLLGDAGWTGLHHDFVVEEGAGPVELMCELRAYAGEAWFDLESLRLVRK